MARRYGFRGLVDPSLQARPHDLIRQDDEAEDMPTADVVHEDPRSLRGRYHDDKVWGGAETMSQKVPSGSLPNGFQLVFQPPAELVRLTLRPPRLAALQVIFRFLNPEVWNSDTGTWSIGLSLGLGLGRAADELQIFEQVSAPFSSVVWSPLGKITNPPRDPLVFTARNMYATPLIVGPPVGGGGPVGYVSGATYQVRVSAYACPYYNHPEDEG